jgi:hypothetical protein
MQPVHLPHGSGSAHLDGRALQAKLDEPQIGQSSHSSENLATDLPIGPMPDG